MLFYLSYNTKKLKFCDLFSYCSTSYLFSIFFNVQSVKILTLNHLLLLINNDNFPIPESEEIKCYIHGVSPVKDVQFSGREYFNCTVKKKDGPVRAVSFSPNKHLEFTRRQKAKSLVKVSNYTKSKGKDIVFNQYTKITPIDDIDFQHSSKLLITGLANTIASLNEVAPEQLISVKAEIAEVSGVKIVNTQHQGMLKKQEVLVRDTTSPMKVVLWEDNVEQLEKNKTYILKNLK
ncbi:Hypothetical predicted protein, partial [Paramuricea clavata]